MVPSFMLKPGEEITKDKLICEWDPYNAVIISEVEVKLSFENVIEGITYRMNLMNRPVIRKKLL